MIHRRSDFNESTPVPKPRWGLHQIFPAYVAACLIAGIISLINWIV